jgi:methylmalonyl-CoA epimerase
MTPFPLDHVGIATPSIDGVARQYELLTGARCSPVEALPERGVNAAFVGDIELIEPCDADSPLHRFLERRGPGLHHLAYRVPDVRETLALLRREGFEPLDEEPRPGARGHLVAFLHPRGAGGVLWEIVQG